MMSCITHMTILPVVIGVIECKKTNELNICHKLLYILWLLEQI